MVQFRIAFEDPLSWRNGKLGIVLTDVFTKTNLFHITDQRNLLSSQYWAVD